MKAMADDREKLGQRLFLTFSSSLRSGVVNTNLFLVTMELAARAIYGYKREQSRAARPTGRSTTICGHTRERAAYRRRPRGRFAEFSASSSSRACLTPLRAVKKSF